MTAESIVHKPDILREQLRVAEERYRSLFDSIDQGFCVIEVLFDDAGEPIDYIFLEVNRAFEAQTGLHDSVGKRMRHMVPQHEKHWFEIYGRIARTGRPRRFELQAAALNRWYDVYAFRVDQPELCRVAVLFSDISDRKQAENQREMLLREMDHRVKNLLTIANSIVTLSARSAKTPADMVRAIHGRLGALAIAHDLARPSPTQQGPEHRGTTLEQLLRTIFSPYVGREGSTDRLLIHGPDTPLGQGAVTTLALILHELATNAAKYGALSSHQGLVTVDWSVDAGELHLTWTERDGPTLPGPASSEGFGSLLARQSVEDQLGGRLFRDWRADGLIIRLTIPVQSLMA